MSIAYIRLRQVVSHIHINTYIRPQGMLWMKLRVKSLNQILARAQCVVCVYELPLYELYFDQLTKNQTKNHIVKMFQSNWRKDEKDKWHYESSDHNIFPKPIGHEKLPVPEITIGRTYRIYRGQYFCIDLSASTHECIYFAMSITWHWLIMSNPLDCRTATATESTEIKIQTQINTTKLEEYGLCQEERKRELVSEWDL